MAIANLRTLGKIVDCGLVAVVRAESPEQASRIADACAQAGVAALEITFTVPDAASLIAELARRYPKGEMLIGAGTVLDPETAAAAVAAGAQFVVAPCLSVQVAHFCNRRQIPYMPGAGTVKEIVEAMECGAEIIK